MLLLEKFKTRTLLLQARAALLLTPTMMLHVAEVQEAAVDDARKSVANVEDQEAAAAGTHAALMPLLKCRELSLRMLTQRCRCARNCCCG